MHRIQDRRAAPVALILCCVGMVFTGYVVSWSPPNGSEIPATESIGIPEKLTADGLENLWKFAMPEHRVLFSGGQPEGETGFRSLQSLGVRTVISVDGARPDLESARKYHLQYVHLPIGYDDVREERRAALVQAVRNLPGPVYVHCHHGKHRGPAAAVCLWRGLNSAISPDQATKMLMAMGTAKKYGGLYRAVTLPTAVSVGHVHPSSFPEFTEVRPLAQEMVAIDHDWERLQRHVAETSQNGSQPALIRELSSSLSERFRESARLLPPKTATSSNELSALLNEFAEDVQRLGDGSQLAELSTLRDALQQLKRRCDVCHAQFRD